MNIAREGEWAHDNRSVVLRAKFPSVRATLRSGRLLTICGAGMASAALAVIVTADAPMNTIFYGAAFGLIVVLGLLPTAIRYHGEPYDWVSPVTLFSASYALVFTFGSIYQAIGINPLSRVWSIENFPITLFYAVLGLAGFQIGYYYAPWRRLPEEANVRSWRWERAVVAYYCLLLIVWAVRLYLAVLGVGSGRVYFATTYELSFWEKFLMVLTQHLSFGIVPLALLLNRHYRGEALRILAPASVAFEFLYWVVVSWRSQLLINGVAFFVAYVLPTARGRLRRVVWVSAVIVFVVLPVIDTTRDILTDSEKSSRNPMFYVAAEVMPRAIGETFRDPNTYEGAVRGVYQDITARFNPLDFFAEVVDSVQVQGYMLGETLVANLWVLVPRIVWPGKPSAVGAKNLIQEWYGLWMEDTMLTQPLELYANFGPLGVLLGMMAVGLMYRGIFQVSLLRYPSSAGVFLYAVTVVLYVFHERDLFNSTLDFLRVWAIFWLIAWWVGWGHGGTRRVMASKTPSHRYYAV